MTSTRLSEETIEKILSLNASGLPTSTISSQLGLPRRTVGYHLGKRGLVPAVEKRTDRARPIHKVEKRCGCRLVTYLRSIDVKLCDVHIAPSERLVRQLLSDALGISELELPVSRRMDSRPLEPLPKVRRVLV